MKRDDKIDLGSVQVHKKVFAEIVSSALDEIKGVNKVLDAAALTYVAAAVAAVGQFLYYVLLLGGGRRR